MQRAAWDGKRPVALLLLRLRNETSVARRAKARLGLMRTPLGNESAGARRSRLSRHRTRRTMTLVDRSVFSLSLSERIIERSRRNGVEPKTRVLEARQLLLQCVIV